MLQERIDELVKQHGSLRAAARVLQVDHVYLWRLHCGKKNNPSDALLRKLKLRRVVTVEYVPHNAGLEARREAPSHSKPLLGEEGEK